jgi:phage host-nuclease inhibitor protein Gam
MENDKQMTDRNLDQAKNIFLSDELLVKNAKPEVYSLPEEFAKSKKNKNLLVYALILLYVGAIGIGAFLLTTLEENKSKRVEVDIAEFKQFNFMELLAQKKENEEKLVKLQQELDDLRTNSMKEIQKLSPQNQQKAIAELNDKLKKLEDSYSQQITSKEESLKVLEKSINKEQQQISKTVQESQSQVKNYQNINQMQGDELVRLNTEYGAKIAKLTADHQAEIERLNKDHQTEIDNLKKDNQALISTLTLRYNPTFSQGEIVPIINSKLGNTANSTMNKFDKILSNADILSEQDFNQLHKKIQNQKVILNNLQQIPYTNSVPLALNRLDRLSQSIIGDYETLWGNLLAQVNEKNDDLSSYEYAVNYLSMIRRESGYVMDARNPNRIIIFVDHVFSVKNGDIAYILKNDDTPIAKIELNLEHGRIIAKVKEILKPIKIEPFDKILIKLGAAQ